MIERGIVHPTLVTAPRYTVSNKKIHLDELKNDDHNNELEAILQVLEKGISEAVLVDITNPALQIPCVKVILPELEFSLLDGSPNQQRRVDAINAAILSHLRK